MTEETEVKRKKRVKKISVRVVRTREGRSLVEWKNDEGHLQRAFVGFNEVVDSKVAESALVEAIPYGIPWEGAFEEAQKKATPEVRANALRVAGIWTLDDLRVKSQAALGALKAGFGVEIGELNRFARKIIGGN